MQTCGMCGLECKTAETLRDHATGTHNLTPSEMAEVLTAGKKSVDETIAKAWERHAESHGVLIPDLRFAIGDIDGEPGHTKGIKSTDLGTVEDIRQGRAMRPGGYL